MKFRSIGLAVGFAIAATHGVAASAQSAQAQGAVSAEPGLEEIVVTAEKREESSQKTPISMEVITAEEIARKGIADFATLSANDPSVNFSSNGSEGYLTVRGVSSHDVTEIGDPAVPVVIDGFTTIRPYTLTTSLYDLQRIEVLRGPQGTLYGRNASGGLVNIITNKPGKEFGLGASVEFGNYNAQNVTGWINLPLNDMFQLRAAFASRQHEGYRINPPANGYPAERGDDEDSRSERIELAFTPSDVFNGLLTYQITHIGGVGIVDKLINFVPNPDQVKHPGDIDHDKPAIGNTTTFPLYGPQSQNIDDKEARWNFVYSGIPGNVSLTYTGGFDNLQWHHVSSIPTLFSFLGNDFTVPIAFIQNEFPKTVNHELRLSSDSRGPFIWQTGLYYFQERSTNLASMGVTNPFSTLQKTLLDFNFPLVETTSKAAFGQASYSITDDQKVTAGVRYSKDTKSRSGTFDLAALGVFGLDQHGSSESSKTTFHLGYDFSPTATNLYYAKFDTGYKPGGFTTCGSYQPETVSTFEVGTKNRFNENRIQVNVAAFYNKYKDQQISALSNGCSSGTVVQNAGGSAIYGLEASVDALMTVKDKVDVAVSLLHARFDDFVASPTDGNPAASSCAEPLTTANGLNCQLKGNSLPQAPNATLTAGYEHTWAVTSESDLNFRVEGKYQTKQNFDAFNFGDTEQDGYGVANAYLNYSMSKWKITGFIRNLADKDYLVDATEVTTGGAHLYRYGFGAPRTFGIRFEAKL